MQTIQSSIMKAKEPDTDEYKTFWTRCLWQHQAVGIMFRRMSEVDQREAILEGNLLEADEGFSLTLNTLQQEHSC